MSSREKYGHTSIYSDGSRTSNEDNELILEYYFSENDGPRFLRRGPELETHITYFKKDAKSIEQALKVISNEDVRKELSKLLE